MLFQCITFSKFSNGNAYSIHILASNAYAMHFFQKYFPHVCYNGPLSAHQGNAIQMKFRGRADNDLKLNAALVHM